MFGSVATMSALPGRRDQVVETWNRQFREIELIPGYIAHYLYRLDEDPDALALAVVFDSRASYVANSRSAEQTARYNELRPLLKEDPTWINGDIEPFMRF